MYIIQLLRVGSSFSIFGGVAIHPTVSLMDRFCAFSLNLKKICLEFGCDILILLLLYGMYSVLQLDQV